MSWGPSARPAQWARAAAIAAALVAGCYVTPIPLRAPYHASDAPLSITRVIHGAVIIDLGGTRFLSDPWYHPGFLPVQREPLGLTYETLPKLAAILLTHRHRDHFDPPALQRLAKRVPVAVCPQEMATAVSRLGFRRVVALDWWEATRIGGVRITAVPARHSVPENGYVLEHGVVSVYLAGDTRFFPGLVDVAIRFPGLDVALLPIGGVRFFGFSTEMTPEQAARAARILGARHVVPVDYGQWGPPPVFWVPRNPARRFLAALRRRDGKAGPRPVVLRPGESWHYFPPVPAHAKPSGGTSQS